MPGFHTKIGFAFIVTCRPFTKAGQQSPGSLYVIKLIWPGHPIKRLPRLAQLFLEVTSPENPGAQFPSVLVGIDRFLVAQLEDVLRLFTEVDVLVHHLIELFLALTSPPGNGATQRSDLKLKLVLIF